MVLTSETQTQTCIFWPRNAQTSVQQAGVASFFTAGMFVNKSADDYIETQIYHLANILHGLCFKQVTENWPKYFQHFPTNHFLDLVAHLLSNTRIFGHPDSFLINHIALLSSVI